MLFTRWVSLIGYWSGDILLNVVSMACCSLLLYRRRQAGAPPQAVFGASLATRTIGDGFVSWLAGWLMLYVLCFVVALGLHMTTPEQVIADDLRFGKLPLVEDFHQAMDTLAILPQFALFTAVEKHKRAVPPSIVFWIIGLAVSRCLAFLSGFASVLIMGYYLRSIEETQFFFTLGQAFNLLILSDFVYYYLKSRAKKRDALELAYDELPL